MTGQRGPLPAIDNLLIDRNRDGFPDDIVGLFAVPENLGRADWEAVLNLAARLGLGSSGFTPPIVASEPLMGRVSVTVRPGDAERLNVLVVGADAPVGTQASTSGVNRPTIDLSDPWSINGFLADHDDDQAADDSAIHLILPDNLPFELGAALADFATRIGLESGSLTMPIAGSEVPPGRVALGIEISDNSHARLTLDSHGDLRFTGSRDALTSAIHDIATAESGFLPDNPVQRGIGWLRRSTTGWTPEGRSAQLRSALVKNRPDRITILETGADRQQELAGLIHEVHPELPVEPASPRETVVFDHQWTAEWEVSRLWQSLEQDILPKLNPDEPVELIAMLSEPPEIRRRIRGQISRKMLGAGFNRGAVHLLDAFKPGLSWLQEVILPELQTLGQVDRIELHARSWPPEEYDGQLDMTIRWLQELFPADEILATELGTSLDQIELRLSTGSDEIYRIIARDRSGEPVLDRTFSPLWRRIDYLAGMPGSGNVTVTTGGIIARQSGETHRARVLTDPELFWRYMQGELLPKLRRCILETTNGQPDIDDQPFFEDLFIDLHISTSDEPYGIRQERHSAAEALHEDIYFNVLDFIEEIGLTTTGQRLSAPGSVRPFVMVTPGRQPEARVRLTRRPAGIARILSEGQVHLVQPTRKTLPETPVVTALEFSRNRVTAELAPDSEIANHSGLLESLAKISPAMGAHTVVRVPVSPDETVEIGIPEPVKPAISETIVEGPVPDDTIISNPELFPHLNRLAQHPAVTLVPAAETSWQGRPIPAVAVTTPQGAAVWSLRKLSHFKPTKLIVARHHANEVASTTSALQLIEALTGDPTGEAMLAGINVVLLPLENPDGAALHDQLRRGNPTWKHHPARYNATGYEFGEDQANPDSRYGEGRVRDLVWNACLPDVVVDNHGVPSHEWAQLFAGFGSPPRFNVSFWQVQALLYGILPSLDDSVHLDMRERVRERVASTIAADEDLLHWNRIYTERYRTWGHQWLPDRFPLTLFGEMLFHLSTIDPESVRGKRSYAARYPRTTVLDWITEVCDETVEGEHLKRTARAHLLTNIAVLELLREQTKRLNVETSTTPHGTRIRTGRERPLRMNI